MKKLFFSFLATLVFSLFGNAQIEKKEPWPYGCRTHSITIGNSFISYSTEFTLCCIPTNWKTPPITCWEANKTSNNNIYFQYVMLSEIEEKLKTELKDKSLTISTEEILSESNSSYKLINKDYLVEYNDLNERFVKLEFVKIN